MCTYTDISRHAYVYIYNSIWRYTSTRDCLQRPCNTLHHSATHCNTPPRENAARDSATPCNRLQHTVTHWHTHLHGRLPWETLKHPAKTCITLQHTATPCNNLHHTATHCNTPPRETALRDPAVTSAGASHTSSEFSNACVCVCIYIYKQIHKHIYICMYIHIIYICIYI